MDIFANWRKGKKEHDKKVYFEAPRVIPFPGEPADRVRYANGLLHSINAYATGAGRTAKVFEAKHWQILAEYAQDQVKALTQEDKPEFSLPATADGSTLKTVIERAEKRHGYGIKA